MIACVWSFRADTNFSDKLGDGLDRAKGRNREVSMLKRALSLAAVLAFLATPVWAAHCPKDVKAIDAALAKDHGLSTAQVAKVKKLRDVGEAQHNSGKHADSIKELHQALKILGIAH